MSVKRWAAMGVAGMALVFGMCAVCSPASATETYYTSNSAWLTQVQTVQGNSVTTTTVPTGLTNVTSLSLPLGSSSNALSMSAGSAISSVASLPSAWSTTTGISTGTVFGLPTTLTLSGAGLTQYTGGFGFWLSSSSTRTTDAVSVTFNYGNSLTQTVPISGITGTPVFIGWAGNTNDLTSISLSVTSGVGIYYGDFSGASPSVPEPASLAIFAAGLVGFSAFRLRKRRA